MALRLAPKTGQTPRGVEEDAVGSGQPDAVSANLSGAPSERSRIRRPERGRFSPLTRRILVVNITALAFLVAGLLFLGRYEGNLIEGELAALRTEAEIFAGALGEGAYGTRANGGIEIRPEVAGPMLRRLVSPTLTRARLFSENGDLIADSRRFLGPWGATVQIIELPPPEDDSAVSNIVDPIYEWILRLFPGRGHLPRYTESPDSRAADYEEAIAALSGEVSTRLRIEDSGPLVLSAAAPVQRFKQVIGVILLTKGGSQIDDAVRSVRFDILKMFAAALAITVLLSIYLAGTIVRPLRRLAEAADRVRTAPGRDRTVIPRFESRNDEIGDLANDLRAMTEALWQRLDAIESFAADVAHEIKNPLTSLRSAVETAARITDPDQQQRLMEIILDDVQRLDRLISDISDASRLDAELSRDEQAPVDLSRLLAALVEIHQTSGAAGNINLVFSAATDLPVAVLGSEGRLVQVFQNLFSNALSFSPPDGCVAVRIRADDGLAVVTFDDDGPGIPDASLFNIFDRFYSERPEGEQFGTHSGLGLSISRQIVEAHDGMIRAENRNDQSGRVAGARFVVCLPLAAA
jgi:two-component system, OmpR family, sensor histidine kinase ChvG